jgi:hypothetical protein
MRNHTTTYLRRLKPGTIDFVPAPADVPLHRFAQRLRVLAHALRAQSPMHLSRFSVLCCPETNEVSVLRLR